MGYFEDEAQAARLDAQRAREEYSRQVADVPQNDSTIKGANHE